VTFAFPFARQEEVDSMPLLIMCSSCQTRLRVGDDRVGRKMKCPKCQTIFTAASADSGAASAPAARAKAPPARAPLEVEVGDEDVIEAGPHQGKSAGHPDQSFEELEVPDSMREEIEKNLTKKEKIVWIGRASMKLMMSNARLGRIIGIILLCVLAATLVITIALQVAGLVVWIICGFLGLIGALLLFVPWLTQRGEKVRPTYVLTNRQVIICQYMGFRGANIRTYTPDRLNKMERREWRRFPGDGDLIFEKEVFTTGGGPSGGGRFRRGPGAFGRTSGQSHEHTTTIEHGFMMIERVGEVEKLVREKLIEPFSI
jgi:predicted Zn finger-like uncharacterized protein